MKKMLRLSMLGLVFCLLSSLNLQAQSYSPSEVLGLKKVFAVLSADGTTTNGSKVGVADTATWNPATTPAGLIWRSIGDTMRVVEINWAAKGMAGSFPGNGFLNELNYLEVLNAPNNSFMGLRTASMYLRELIVSGNKTLQAPTFWNSTTGQITNMDSLRIFDAGNTNIGNVQLGSTSMRNLHTLICDSSNVTNLVISTVGLPKLTTLKCEGNRLSSFTGDAIMSAPLLATVGCENNQFNQFSKLPKQSSITTYTYAPQTSFWNLSSKFWKDTLDLSSENAVVKGGITRYTTYTWFDITTGTETPITIASDNNGKFTFTPSQAGKKLRCKMTNSNFPGLTTIAEIAVFKYDDAEIAALKQFFALPSTKADTTNGLALGVVDTATWEPTKTSAGISWTSSGEVRHVESFFWDQKGLAGDLNLSSFTSISTFRIVANKITSVTFNPAMTTMSNVYAESNLLSSLELPVKLTGSYGSIRIKGNKLKFSTLPKNKAFDYQYAPQATIDGGEIASTATVDLSAEFTVTINGGSAETDYQWVDITDGTEKNVDGISSPSRGKFQFATSLEGKTLRCKMTNDSLPQLKGDSALRYEVRIKVDTTSAYDPNEVAALKAFFALPSATSGQNNGGAVGIADVANWNPAIDDAKLIWNDETPKRLKEIYWQLASVAGSLDLKPMKKIEKIDLTKNPITRLELADITPALTHIYVMETLIDTIIMPKSAPLFASFRGNLSPKLAFVEIPTDASQMFEFWAHTCNLTHLRFPQTAMNRLEGIWVYRNKLEELVLPPSMPNLRYLFIYRNRLTSINMPVQYLQNLQHLYVEKNAFTFATLPAYPKDLATYDTITGKYAATPQDTMKGGNIDYSAGIDLSSQYSTTVNGNTATTVYTWTDISRGTPVPAAGITASGNGRFTLSNTTTGRTFRCTMTNANYPQFTKWHNNGSDSVYNEGMIYEVTINGTIGINTNEVEKISIYPNPANEVIFIQGLNNIQRVEIFNTLGILVKNQTNQTSEINVSDLRAGIYTLRVHTATGNIINKQVVIVK